jgi:hypothetical protein
LVDESVRLLRGHEDRVNLVATIGDLAMLHLSLDDTDTARSLIDEGISLAHQIQDPFARALAKLRRGWFLLYTGEAEPAMTQLAPLVADFREAGDHFNEVGVLYDLGAIALLTGQVRRAMAYFAECLQCAQTFGHRGNVVDALEGLAAASAQNGDAAVAARLFGAATAGRQVVGGAMRSRYRHLRHYKRHLDALRDAVLSADATHAAFAAGTPLALDAAVAYALESAHDAVRYME